VTAAFMVNGMDHFIRALVVMQFMYAANQNIVKPHSPKRSGVFLREPGRS
jgi:hypothetical protein